MNAEEIRIIISRLSALGYQEENLPTKENFLLLQKEEPFKQKLIIIGNSLQLAEEWRSFIIQAVLTKRSPRFPIVVGIIIFSHGEDRVEKTTLDYIAETPWVEVIWEEVGNKLVIRKPHFRWEIEDKVVFLASRHLQLLREQERTKAKEEVRLYPQPWLTYFLLMLNLAVFLVEIILGGSNKIGVLIQLGAKYNPRIWMGEYWRLLTPLLLHAGWEHFLFNSIALLQLGTLVERLFGKVRFFWIYLLSGIFGSVASALFRADTISVGASGAIFGLLGGLVYFSIRKPFTAKKLFGRNLWIMLGINLMLGFIIPGIDYTGHLGGLVGGLLSAYTVGLGENDTIPNRWVWMVILLVVLTFSTKTALTPPQNNWHLSLEEGRIALERGDETLAREKLEQSYTLNPRFKMTQKMLAGVYLEQGYRALDKDELDEAVLYLEKSQDLDRGRRETKNQLLKAYLYRGFNRYNSGEINGAEEDCLKGIALNEKIEGFHYILGAVYYRQNRIQEAIREIEQVLKINPDNKNAQALLEELKRIETEENS